MGARFGDRVWLPLLIGVVIAIVVAALRFLGIRLWVCLMKLIKTQTAVGESAHDQPLPDSDAAALANGVPDLEMGNDYGRAEGGTSVTEPELEPGLANSGEALKAQVTRDAARGALVPVEMDVLHSQEEEGSSWSCRNVSCMANAPSPDDPTSLS